MPTPDYIPLLDAYHQVQRETIVRAMAGLPLGPGHVVLDAPCGDGFYANLLADAVSPHGSVIGADQSNELLEIARRQHHAELVEFKQADSYQLSFDEGAFDLVWCAQSFISLSDAQAALGEMVRVLKPGGFVAIWENDELHHTLLPWPPQLEIALQHAARAAQREKHRSPDKIYAGRYVRRHLRRAGLQNLVRQTFATDHQEPLSAAAKLFVDHWLASLRERLADHLEVSQRAEFDRLTRPESSEYLPDQPDFEVACIDILTLGQKPD